MNNKNVLYKQVDFWIGVLFVVSIISLFPGVPSLISGYQISINEVWTTIGDAIIGLILVFNAVIRTSRLKDEQKNKAVRDHVDVYFE